MKIKPNLFFLLLFISPLMAFSQQSGIETALQKGNAPSLGIYFNKTVDLAIPDAEDTYTAGEAVTVLSDFFARQTVKGYKKNHVSTPQEGRAAYSIGDLHTANGTFRITLYYDAQQKITEIRIQK